MVTWSRPQMHVWGRDYYEWALFRVFQKKQAMVKSGIKIFARIRPTKKTTGVCIHVGLARRLHACMYMFMAPYMMGDTMHSW